MKKILWKISSLWTICSNPRKVLGKKEDLTSSYFSSVKTFDYQKSREPVFSDDYGQYFGLKESQVMRVDDKDIYLCDNHNKILVPLFHAYSSLKRPLHIVHIDAHRDDALFLKEKPKYFNEESLRYLLSETRISDFFDALSETGVIKTINRYTESESYLSDKEVSCDVLSLDIDIFGPEGDFVDLESKIKTIARFWNKVPVVCIAMSPGFIDQDYAREIIKIFLKKGT